MSIQSYNILDKRLIMNYVSIKENNIEISDYNDIIPKSLHKAHESRVSEYVLGRLCAQFDINNLIEIEKDIHGVPVWPDGMKGSISHSKDYALAVISKSDEIRSIGVDIERTIRQDKLHIIEKQILTDSEFNLFNSRKVSKEKLATIIFSAKESLYKLLNPLCNTYISFKEGIFKSYDPISNNFQIELRSKKQELAPFLGEYSGKIYEFDNNIISLLILNR
jgi:4'-phosphopantetheinyl transferase EntD